MTDANKNPDNNSSVFTYIDNLGPSGGTNFNAAFQKAYDIFENSTTVGTNTSGCLKAILFLTDGESTLDLDLLKQKSAELGFIVFSYALGNGADSEVTQSASCDSGGISYIVPDGGNLSNIMASYYEYFASGIKDLNPRWLQYNDFITNDDLLSSCAALYDENKFKGVSCMDINLILDLTTLQNKSDYSSTFTPALQEANRTCTTFDFAALGIDIEQLRGEMGGQRC